MEDHFLDINETSDDFQITDTVKRSVLKFANWVRVLGILGVVMIGLGLIIDVAIIFEATRRTYYREEQLFMALMLFIALILIGVLSVFALQYARKIKKAFEERSSELIEKAFNKLSIVVIISSTLFLCINAFGFFMAYIIIDAYSNRYY